VAGAWKKELETSFGDKYIVSSAEWIGIPVRLTTVSGQKVELSSGVEAYVVINKESDAIRKFVKHEGTWYILIDTSVEDDPNASDEFFPYDLATKKNIEVQETWWDNGVETETIIVESADWKTALEKAYPGAVVSKDTNLTRPITVQTLGSSSIPLPSGSIEAYKVEGTSPSDVLVYLIRYNGAWYKHDNTKDGTVYVPHELPAVKSEASFVRTDVAADVFDDEVVETKVVSWDGQKIIKDAFPNWRVGMDADIKPGDKIELRLATWSPVVLENNIEAYLVQGTGEPVYLVRYNNAWYAYDDTITHENKQEKPNFVYVPCELKDVLVEKK